MGHKPSSNMQSDRPESGGADHDNQHENSGLLDREKAKFAMEEQEKMEAAPVQKATKHAPFSINSERNSNPRRK